MYALMMNEKAPLEPEFMWVSNDVSRIMADGTVEIILRLPLYEYSKEYMELAAEGKIRFKLWIVYGEEYALFGYVQFDSRKSKFHTAGEIGYLHLYANAEHGFKEGSLTKGDMETVATEFNNQEKLVKRRETDIDKAVHLLKQAKERTDFQSNEYTVLNDSIVKLVAISKKEDE